MGQALYRKYRSKSFDEVIGQNHITIGLKKAVETGNLAHAYLFVGPRGVGKTSIARILAYEANSVAYNSSESQLDIIEIDAASNRRIDEIRDLRQKISIAPTNSKYKVYIIDEVHMLTKEAHNALLKTLEEPPAHAIFILATTDINKIPDTIVSRCVRYTFKPIDNQSLTIQLSNIAKKEKIKITDDALEVIAHHAEGSSRDALSILDQVKNTNDNLTKENVEESLGILPSNLVEDLINVIESKDRVLVYEAMHKFWEQSIDPIKLASMINANIINRYIDNNLDLSQEIIFELLGNLLEVPSAYDPKSKLELSLLKPTDYSSPIFERKIKKDNDVKEPITEELDNTSGSIELNNDIDNKMPEHSWNEVLKQIKLQNNTLYGIARMAKSLEDEESITIEFKFPFHHKKFEDASNRKVLEDIVHKTSNKKLIITLDDSKNAKKPEIKATEPNLSTITNIFGSTEVLES